MVRVRCKGPLVAPTHTLSRNRVPNLLPGVIDLLEGGHVKVSLATGGQQQRLALLVAERKGFGINGALQNVSPLSLTSNSHPKSYRPDMW